jgi:B9 domain-containing protein 2
MHGRTLLAGYGFCHVPVSPGEHKLDVAVWRPKGTALEEFSAFFLGGHSHLREPQIVDSEEDR